jgi:hypothetical protein
MPVSVTVAWPLKNDINSTPEGATELLETTVTDPVSSLGPSDRSPKVVELRGGMKYGAGSKTTPPAGSGAT